MSREMIAGLSAGAASGLLFALGVVGGGGAVLLIYVTMLPLLLAGLGYGVRGAAVAAFVGSVVVYLMTGGLLSAVIFVALAGLPAIQVAQFTLVSFDGDNGRVVWYPWGRLLVWLTGLGMILLLTGLLVVPHSPGGLEEAIRVFINRMVELLAGKLPDADRNSFAAAQASLFPAGVAVGWLMMVIGNGLVAQAILVRLGKALRPMPVMTELDLPLAAVWLLAVPGLGIGFGVDIGYICRNLAMVALVPLVFAGLASVHRTVASWPQANMARVGFYGAFLVGSAKVVMAVAVLGLVEIWARRYEEGSTAVADKEDE
jgi:hypothetical protein